jgi:hypothetical protein
VIVAAGNGKWRCSFGQRRGDIDEIRSRRLADEILLPFVEAAGGDVMLLAKLSLSEPSSSIKYLTRPKGMAEIFLLR